MTDKFLALNYSGYANDPYIEGLRLQKTFGDPLMRMLDQQYFARQGGTYEPNIHTGFDSSYYSSAPQITTDLNWVLQPNFGVQMPGQLNGNVPVEVVTRPPQTTVIQDGQVVQVGNQQELRQIQNLFQNPAFLESLVEADGDNVRIREGNDHSFWTRGMNKDDLVNAAIRHYSIPELQQYFGTTNTDEIRERLGGQADDFLRRNANNSDDAGWDRSGVTGSDIAIAHQKATNRNLEIDDPRFAQFLQDHFETYARGGMFNSDSYINRDELKRAIDDWNNSRYAQVHGRIVYNDHILGEKLNDVAERTNNEWGDESQIHIDDLRNITRGRSREETFYDIPRQ